MRHRKNDAAGAVTGGGLLPRFLVALLLLGLVPAQRALAFGGLELSPGGTRAIGRGGAVSATASDSLALLHNPAALALLPDQQLLFGADVPLHDMCVRPYGYYGWGVYGVTTAGDADFARSEFGDAANDRAYARDAYDRVCNSAPVLPALNLAYSLRLGDKLGLGFGFIAPTSLASLQYGGEDGTIDTPDGGRPTPTRYQLIRQRFTFAFGPSIGVGYSVLPRLRVGVTVIWVGVAFETLAVQAFNAGMNPRDDMLIKVTGKDYFIPGATFGVHATPIDPLDVALTLRMLAAFDGSGDVRYTTHTYQTGATSGPEPYVNDPIGLSRVHTKVPWTLTAGVRYADRLPRADCEPQGGPEQRDPLADERFDVELDLGYQLNARASEAELTIEPGELVFRDVDGTSTTLEIPNPDFDDFSVDKHLVDAATIRLGGTYNVLPGLLGVSAGTFYETRGVDAAYASIDGFAFARAGVGLGVLLRAADWDFAVSYGHIFQERLVVAPPAHQVRERADQDDVTSGFDKRVGVTSDGQGGEVLREQNPPKASEIDATAKLTQSAAFQGIGLRPRVVNAGVYTASFDLFGASVAYRF